MNAGVIVKFSSVRWQVPQVRPFPPNVSSKKICSPRATRGRLRVELRRDVCLAGAAEDHGGDRGQSGRSSHTGEIGELRLRGYDPRHSLRETAHHPMWKAFSLFPSRSRK